MSASSGVEVPDACIDVFEEMKKRHKLRCIIYVIKDEREFYIYKKFDKGDGDQKEEFDAIVADMKLDPCLLGLGDSGKASPNSRNPCVMVCDLNVPSEGKASKDVLLIMKVCLDEGIPIKKKMLMGSSYEILKGKLKGIMKKKEIASIEDLNYEDVLNAMK